MMHTCYRFLTVNPSLYFSRWLTNSSTREYLLHFSESRWPKVAKLTLLVGLGYLNFKHIKTYEVTLNELLKIRSTLPITFSPNTGNDSDFLERSPKKIKNQSPLAETEFLCDILKSRQFRQKKERSKSKVFYKRFSNVSNHVNVTTGYKQSIMPKSFSRCQSKSKSCSPAVLHDFNYQAPQPSNVRFRFSPCHVYLILRLFLIRFPECNWPTILEILFLSGIHYLKLLDADIHLLSVELLEALASRCAYSMLFQITSGNNKNTEDKFNELILPQERCELDLGTKEKQFLLLNLRFRMRKPQTFFPLQWITAEWIPKAMYFSKSARSTWPKTTACGGKRFTISDHRLLTSEEKPYNIYPTWWSQKEPFENDMTKFHFENDISLLHASSEHSNEYRHALFLSSSQKNAAKAFTHFLTHLHQRECKTIHQSSLHPPAKSGYCSSKTGSVAPIINSTSLFLPSLQQPINGLYECDNIINNITEPLDEICNFMEINDCKTKEEGKVVEQLQVTPQPQQNEPNLNYSENVSFRDVEKNNIQKESIPIVSTTSIPTKIPVCIVKKNKLNQKCLMTVTTYNDNAKEQKQRYNKNHVKEEKRPEEMSTTTNISDFQVIADIETPHFGTLYNKSLAQSQQQIVISRPPKRMSTHSEFNTIANRFSTKSSSKANDSTVQKDRNYDYTSCKIQSRLNGIQNTTSIPNTKNYVDGKKYKKEISKTVTYDTKNSEEIWNQRLSSENLSETLIVTSKNFTPNCQHISFPLELKKPVSASSPSNLFCEIRMNKTLKEIKKEKHESFFAPPLHLLAHADNRFLKVEYNNFCYNTNLRHVKFY